METSPCCNSIAGPQIVIHLYPCHGSTVVVPCTKFCSDHFVRIEREWNKIAIEFELQWKNRYWNGAQAQSFAFVLVTILACFISIRWTSHMYYTPGLLTIVRSGHHVSGVLNTGCELRCSIINPAISTKVLPDRGVGPNCRDIISCRYITYSAWNKCMFWTNVSCGIFTVNPKVWIPPATIRYVSTDNILVSWASMIPDNKVYVAHMGPTWFLSAPGGPHLGPMNLDIKVNLAVWL